VANSWISRGWAAGIDLEDDPGMAIARRRFSWLGAAVAVSMSAYFAASAVGHFIEARYLVVARAGPVAAPRRADVRVIASKDGGALVARNMFCSACATVEAGPGPEPEPGIPLTALPLELVATNLVEPSRRSFATIRATSASGQQGSFWLGDSVPGGGPIESIGATQVVFVNDASARRERLSLLSAAPAAVRKPRKRGRAASPYGEQIRKVDATSFEIDRALVKELMLAPPTNVGARVRPVSTDGKVAGFKVYAIRRQSLLHALGVENGDVIEAVNGMALTTPDKLLEIYGRLRDADNFEVRVARGGKPVTMRYVIR
jgi:type II secretion system protein C